MPPSHDTQVTSLDTGRGDCRERLLCSGERSLSDEELLTILIGTGCLGHSAREIARRLLDAADGLVGLARAGARGIEAQPGIGVATATRVMAALELGRRLSIRELATARDVVCSFECVARWAIPRLAPLEHEEVWLLCLDARNGLKSRLRIAQGGQHGCALSPRDVLRPAIRDSASGIVLVHNHPSGDATPSAEDLAMTEQVALAADLVGIPLVDHVVVARGGARSIRQLGVLDP